MAAVKVSAVLMDRRASVELAPDEVGQCGADVVPFALEGHGSCSCDELVTSAPRRRSLCTEYMRPGYCKTAPLINRGFQLQSLPQREEARLETGA